MFFNITLFNLKTLSLDKFIVSRNMFICFLNSEDLIARQLSSASELIVQPTANKVKGEKDYVE